ncbi:hypothetical protein H5V43_04070 [Sphingobium fuliginis]|jgi:predicted RNA-binding Zn-ribbon protein involved in translation (DUF1610 family)|uniref:Uncharacterized protein n=1 Tax=Sphingobium fuliginis (strain ATCC 27551) TaxID=336203 RepID=A0A7M2GHZ0_SPHSA|nr:hypothetical protein [Sphingobium fuliginis]QOT72330.1 hypothetical protein H5V43_04070 [Sphingobium fuliginis]
MIAHGGCTEPGGVELADERWEAPCPRCGQSAEHGHVERAEGSLNIHHTLACDHCGHQEGFDWMNP